MAERRRSSRRAKTKAPETKAEEFIPLKTDTDTAEITIPGLGGNEEEEKHGKKRKIDDEDTTMTDQNEAAPGGDEKDGNGQVDEQMESEPPAEKRRAFLQQRKKRRFLPYLHQDKNPLMVLNELKPGLEYRLTSQEGPSHAPVFVMSVTVNNDTFEGRGSSKQKAKQDAAVRALKTFVQPNRFIGLPGALQTQNADFTSDAAGNLLNNFGGESENCDVTDQEMPLSKKPSPPAVLLIEGKHPVMLLNERYSQNVQYEIVNESGLPHEKNFTCKVSVGGKEFFGSGRNKRIAKSKAAEEALLGLDGLRVSYDNHPAEAMQQSSYKSEEQMNQSIADHIGKIIMEKFNSLKAGLPDNIRRKVLAGIVMTENIDNELKYTVIGLGTGTKCVGGEYMSDKGLAVNDCHGEIISRRCLLRFLYSELSKCVNGDGNTCFIKKEEGTPYGLKDHIDFHLFVSTSPCGDARVFSPHEQEVGETDQHPSRRSRGLLRTKIEIGEGEMFDK